MTNKLAVILLLILAGCKINWSSPSPPDPVPPVIPDPVPPIVEPVDPIPPPTPVPVPPKPEPNREPTYEEKCKLAVEKDVPLAVGVDCIPLSPPDWLWHVGTTSSFEGESKGVIVGVPVNGELVRIDLPWDATARQMREAVEALRNPPRRQATRIVVRQRGC